ncbi:hypothetical protein NMQ03_07165 [Arthrobacter sp. DNA4]|uniref:hypothetical protein n=1 Tax=Arthrobacter sp. DNA4 TaxID=2963432 RepID=UPI0020CD5273|nr:hypothetical protein [Arthrobacter sp. DNA4]UTT70885.1 hypothetical protein NMQ03_07165 [Arthrobacter sp. DNA4]
MVSLRPTAPPAHQVMVHSTAPQADSSVRLVTGFAGFGAGSVNLAISSSLLAAGSPGPAGLLAGVVAGLWGAALLAGAVAFLARDRLAGNRWARYALAGAAAAHLAAIAFPTFGLSLTQLSALLLTLMIIASLGWLQRHSGQQDSAQQDSAQEAAGAGMRPGRLLLAAFAGAVLVAGITTPGLAASTTGQYAVPHGEHGNLAPGGHHQR